MNDRRLPPNVLKRIQQQKDGSMPWTSDLSVKEWFLMKKIGFEPIGQVMGSCVYHIGYSIAQSAGTWNSGELSYIQKPYEESRKIAIQRMSDEAQGMGADAVVGIKFLAKPGPSGTHQHITEFIVVGTAVRIQGYHRTTPKPILCTVNGQELVQLINAGALPIGLVMGISIYYKYTTQQEEWNSESWYNRELTTYTQAVQMTRNNALHRMKNEAAQIGADLILAHQTEFKVIGVEVERSATTYTGKTEFDRREDHVLEFIALGTAIQYERNFIPSQPKMVLDLSGKMREKEKIMKLI